MNFNTLRKSAKKAIAEATEKCDAKVVILGDCATQHLATVIRGYGYEESLIFDVLDTDYNQILPQTIDPSSELYAHKPDYVVIDMCTEKLYDAYQNTPAGPDRESFADNQLNTIVNYWNLIRNNLKDSVVRVIQFTFPEDDDRSLGNFGSINASSFIYQLRKLNLLLANEASKSGFVYLVDLNRIQLSMGRANFSDSKLYYSAKLPYSMDALVNIASEIVSVIKAIKGSIKKCVVLDLDNTLWGGVVGDDGLEGIQIGELGVGHAFQAFQCWLKELTKTGIILTVCSKNDDDKAREPFEKHPEMVLHLDDIAMFTANWQDKASNIRNQAATLNLGLDSFVFIDDNPFERDQVKSMIPEITVPDMPSDPALYVDYLKSLNLFERASVSKEDSERTKKYQEEAGRRTLENSFASYEEYLAALDMKAEANAFDSFNLPRIAQLSQRSNQFNLRTLRYTEGDVSMRMESEDYLTIYFALKDKFGDHGLISVACIKKLNKGSLLNEYNDSTKATITNIFNEKSDAKIGFIENWFMSCRVLKRTMEQFIINTIVKKSREAGIDTLIGEYIRTPKNNMVSEIYASKGFEKLADNGSQDVGKSAVFILKTDEFKELTTFIE